ncbi:MAG: hypothetical protein A2161_14380 [Candidatus Schekmanbacteria bacterium RBG_13_48_7]|uniref:Uncharacterized protein n=1 Tax=Candidatus Schekmanbacteria bacterium RBG_13_48_7 TaxID=1817878 RepID=A0A1F7RPN5_9BACT|nr:MAG: hypothetical protein A2161_14380 [Candidatus Schekmanbacteria bacterium RBG_13_48_7]
MQQNSLNFTEKIVQNCNLQKHVEELEKNTRKSLIHAEAAMNGLKKFINNGDPDIQEILIKNFLQTILSMCLCAQEYLSHYENLSQIQIKDKKQTDTIKHYIESMNSELEKGILQFFSNMSIRLKILNTFISSTG